MGFLDSKDTLKRLSTLEKSLVKAFDNISILTKENKELRSLVLEANKRSPDFEKEAKNASKMASEYKNKANTTLDETIKIFDLVKSYMTSIENYKADIIEVKSNVEICLSESEETKSEVENKKQETLNSIEKISTQITAIEQLFEDHPDIEDEIESLENFVTKAEENSNKTNQLLRNITNKKTEIDNIFREILGYEETNEESGEDIHISGLKDELEESYVKLEKASLDLSKQIINIENVTKQKFEDALNNFENQNKNFTDEWTSKYNQTHTKIQSLLPNALTAGLSSAFSKKKEDEDLAYEKHKTQFSYGIIGLILVSVIPFLVSIAFLFLNKSWDDVIEKIPRIVLAILPLYLPVLWLAYSSNKKMNLSKRLIEEYTHKEVLSKTFEGLSSQIHALDDNAISADLRIRLLQDFMQVYSENPGKLISNYEASDHPIMEVLEKSYKLDTAVDKLKKIPGLEKVSRILESKSENILKKSEEVVNEGLEAMKKIETEES